jgi:hypothetical protein
MLNPCLVAPSEVEVKPREPFALRYRVVVHDGETPAKELDRLAAEWQSRRLPRPAGGGGGGGAN